MNLVEIFSIILIHWFADFVVQTDEQAKGKSKSFIYLLEHTASYSVVFMLFCLGFVAVKEMWLDIRVGITPIIYFTTITFITHTITDYFTSRLNSKLWSEGKVHNFFVSVGFDQVLHYVQLFLTYYFIFK